uniref:TM2 domain protein n=1 Tax=Clandestinovirus TaxID=2831644 RepID=A0A8F8KQH8_9VIRU|nr:TM2 domain protein [Clandestinovirus]
MGQFNSTNKASSNNQFIYYSNNKMKGVYKIGLTLWATYVVVGCFVAYTTINNKEVASIATFARDSARMVLQDTTYTQCNFDRDCGNGTCYNDNGEKYCKCNGNYISVDNGICNYHQIDKLTMFLVSFFVGFLGVDWFLAIVNPSVGLSAYAAVCFLCLGYSFLTHCRLVSSNSLL